MTDKEVILKIKSGEINYFEFLIKKYSHFLYQYLFLKIKNKDDCEDLLQEIFFSFYKNLSHFDESQPVKTLSF
jgi:RNA polymerase sigma-70 factor, ECF subfamily